MIPVSPYGIVGLEWGQGVAAVLTPKEAVRQLLEVLPDDCSFEEILYRIYVQQKVAKGEEDVAEGREIDQEDMERRLAQWQK